jgi:hypothetical protein
MVSFVSAHKCSPQVSKTVLGAAKPPAPAATMSLASSFGDDSIREEERIEKEKFLKGSRM